MNGWIKLHRQFLEWEWYSDQNTKAVFIHCLLMANIEDKDWRGVNIARGSFISSIRKVAIDTGLSYKAVRVAMDKLIKTSEIAVNGASRWTEITICKYEDYQSGTDNEGRTERQTKGEQRASKGRAKGEQGATTKEYKERKEREEIKEDIYTPEQISKFKSFQQWIIDNAPRVAEMKSPFTIAEYVATMAEFNNNVVADILRSMHNYKPLLKNNVSANLTLRNWMKREVKQEPVKYGRPH